MSNIDGFTRLVKLGLIFPCLTYFFLVGIPTAASMQLEIPIQFESQRNDGLAKPESNETDSGGFQADFNPQPDDSILKLRQELNNLSSITKELREAQERIDAKLLAIESRLNLSATKTPVLTKLALIKPAVTKLAVTKLAVTKLAVTKPAVTKPAVTKPAVTMPASIEPALTTTPMSIKPTLTKPTLTKPTLTKPPSTTRLWRSIEGKTIIATLIKVEAEKVVLTRNGKEATILLKQLCLADREHVATLAQRMNLNEGQRADIKDLGVIR